MKTLVYILPDKDAGVASVIRNLLRFKTNRYKTKALLIHNLLDDAERRIQDDFNADEIVRITYNGKWSSRHAVYKKIIKELDSESLVIINDGGIDLDAVGYINYNISVAYILHGNINHYFNAIKKHENQIQKIVTVSDFLKTKLKTINSDIDIHSIKFPVPNIETVEKQKDISKIRLAFVGSLIAAKGVFEIETILIQLHSKGVPFSLTIIGSGTEESQLKNKLKEFETVVFKGKLPNSEVLKLHENHDVIILPSKTEGLPVVLVEAMKCGVVPMATKLESGIPEIIEHDVNGFMVTLGEVSKYAQHIEQLHHNRSQLKKMSQLCIEKSNQMFDPYLQTKHYEDVFYNTKALIYNIKKSVLDYLPITIAHRFKTYLNNDKK